MNRLTEFLGQFDVASTGYSEGIKWHRLTESPISTFVGYDGENYYTFFDCPTAFESTWLQVATNLYKRSTIGPTENTGLILRFEEIYRDRFATFLLELISQCSNGDDPNDLLSMILPRWFVFWDEPTPLLSPSKQVQLFGELEILNNLIMNIEDRALSTWRSPHDVNDLHDWQGERIHLEAKITSSSPRSIHISSIDQMDHTTAAHDNLCLLIVELDRDPIGINLEEKVNQVREVSRQANCQDRLDELLSLFGYLDRHGPMYNNTYIVQDILFLFIGPMTQIYTTNHLTEDFDSTVKKITQIVDYRNLDFGTVNEAFWHDISQQL
jgi:hypothetical protein